MSLVPEVNGRFQLQNSRCEADRRVANHREMQKSVYTQACISPPWNPSFSRSSPIRRAAGSWRRSGPGSAPYTRSSKPWTFTSPASRGTSASCMRRGSCAPGRKGKSAFIRCAPSHSASWTNGCDSTAACGRPASTGSARSSIGDRRCGQENAGRHTHDEQQEDRGGQGGEHRAKDHHVSDVQRSGRGGREALRLDLQEFQDHQHGPRGGGRSDRERQGAERDVRTRRSAIHGHGRRPVLLVRARDFPLRALRHAGRDRPVVARALRRRGEAALRVAQGQVRGIVANRPLRLGGDDERSKIRKLGESHVSLAEDVENRYQDPHEGLRATEVRDMPTKAKSPTSASPSRPKIRLERTFEVSAKEVWELWTTKEGLESWWVRKDSPRRSTGSTSAQEANSSMP